MLGWEFPPFISGGLGTACYGLTRAMSQLGAEITFVLPRDVAAGAASHVRVTGPSAALQSVRSRRAWLDESGWLRVRPVAAKAVSPYQRPEHRFDGTTGGQVWQSITGEHGEQSQKLVPAEEFLRQVQGSDEHYGADLFEQVHCYARLVMLLAQTEDFDVIHAHDWMTYPAGVAAAAVSGKPLVVHVHSTEFDRSGEHVNQRIYDIERQGVHVADRVIAVSHLTRQIVESRYSVPSEKMSVVYNAIDFKPGVEEPRVGIARDEKIVLFLGRITMQKGPEYFLTAAKKVLEVMDNVKFVMAGKGDMIRHIIEMAAAMGIGHKVLFTGFLRGDDVDRVFRMADLFVMPSVSEPFGLVPLEALRNDVPVIISKQSGIAEVLNHALKVDFWDTNEMANKIVAVLRHPPLQATLREHGHFEVRRLSWEEAARQCCDVYEQVTMPVGV
jgi:glycosyltransferase involved in cell wall biosynthesis